MLFESYLTQSSNGFPYDFLFICNFHSKESKAQKFTRTLSNQYNYNEMAFNNLYKYFMKEIDNYQNFM